MRRFLALMVNPAFLQRAGLGVVGVVSGFASWVWLPYAVWGVR